MLVRPNMFLTAPERSSATQVAILKLAQNCVRFKDIYAMALGNALGRSQNEN